jgi:hypothetical protein
MAQGYLQAPIMHWVPRAEAREYARLQIRPDAATAGVAPGRSSTTVRARYQPHREFVPIGTQPTSAFPTKRQGPVNWNFDYTKGNARRLSPHVSPS